MTKSELSYIADVPSVKSTTIHPEDLQSVRPTRKTCQMVIRLQGGNEYLNKDQVLDLINMRDDSKG